MQEIFQLSNKVCQEIFEYRAKGILIQYIWDLGWGWKQSIGEMPLRSQDLW